MIFLSAGHHPTKPGACFGSFCEHDEAVKWVQRIHSLLGEEHAMLVPPMVLRDKVSFINARGPSIAVEIHFNSAPGGVGRGCCTLYYPGSEAGRVAAGGIQGALERTFERHWDGAMEGYYRMDKSRGPDYFLAKTSCLALIIEPEFIHNKEIIIANRETSCAHIASALLTIEGRL